LQRWFIKNTGIPIAFGATVMLGFVVGLAISSQTFYSFVLEKLRNLGALKAMGASDRVLSRMVTLNCIENVSVPLRIQGQKAAIVEKKAAEMLDTVGLGNRMQHRPNMLSGGQQQRVAIARALVHGPRLIICDEPTAALDSENGAKVMELLRGVAASPDRCVIIVTHDNRVFKYADRMTFMEDGRIDRTETKQVQLERRTVVAPRAGRILQVNVRPGEYASATPKSAALILGDVKHLQVRADVDEQNAPRLQPGQTATAYVKGDTTQPIELSFVRIEPYVVPKVSLTGASTERVDTRVLQVIYSFERPQDHPVYVGQQVDLFVKTEIASVAATVKSTQPFARN